MNELYIYTSPADAFVALTLDTGQIIEGLPAQVQGRNDAHLCQIPKGTTAQGAVLDVQADGFLPFSNRGLVIPAEDDGPAWFALDDVRLAPVPAPPPEPPGPEPPASTDPLDLINAVYATGLYDLSTHAGCGQFVEGCCESLHTYNSVGWVHDRRTPPQNQYNGHAVDACQCVVGEYYGMYDLIQGSVSPEARPVFNYVGPPNPSNACYPAGTCATAVTMKHTPPPPPPATSPPPPAYASPRDTDEGR